MILAEDEASLYLQPTLQTVWALRGQTPTVRSAPGRTSTHFYGTLNLHTCREVVTRTETMDAVASAQHLEDILAAVPDVPLLLFWDRAPPSAVHTGLRGIAGNRSRMYWLPTRDWRSSTSLWRHRTSTRKSMCGR